jgi:hypothetical protein
MRVAVYTIHCTRFFETFADYEWYEMEPGDTYISLFFQIEAREGITVHEASLYIMHRRSFVLINPRHTLNVAVRIQHLVLALARNREERIVRRVLHRHAAAA